MSDTAAEGTRPVAPEIRDQLLDPFITAVRAALGEMAGAELVVRNVCQAPYRHRSGDIAAVLELTSETEGPLILSFPVETATSFARRILTGVAEPDENLIRDCVGEIANVVAGQAEALLAGSRYHFAFTVPRVFLGGETVCPQGAQGCLCVVFGSEHGEFALQLALR
jgi:CheY-specific phosphatase CheX